MSLRILCDPVDDVTGYNRANLHYNLVADGIYRKLREIQDPFSDDYLPYVVAGLVGFDMGRTMGKGNKYDIQTGFAARLKAKLPRVREHLGQSVRLCLFQISLDRYADGIMMAYKCLASANESPLSGQPKKHFHVGATKMLHWIAPDLFLMLDQNVARVFQRHYAVGYSNASQPRYTAKKYLQCLKHAQDEICKYGGQRFPFIEPRTPMARLFDKVAFVEGQKLKQG